MSTDDAVYAALEALLDEYEISHFAPTSAIDAFEDAVRASERAKYAALVEAVGGVLESDDRMGNPLSDTYHDLRASYYEVQAALHAIEAASS